jgi:type IV fimbrial biogenesis protein FimT
MHERHTGFTLVEAVACLAIGSVLFGLAIPLCGSALARVDASAARAALLASLTDAIRHSALTGTEVVLCPGDRGGCRNSFDWSDGWIAYADIDGDRKRGAGETLLRAQDPLPSRVRLLTSTGRRRLVFQPGGGNAGSNATFLLCDARGPEEAVTLVLANTGRLRAARASPRRARQCRLAMR